MDIADALNEVLTYGLVKKTEIDPFIRQHQLGETAHFEGPDWFKDNVRISPALQVLADRLADENDPREPIVRRNWHVSGKTLNEHLADMLEYGDQKPIAGQLVQSNRKSLNTVDGQPLQYESIRNRANGKVAHIVHWHPSGVEGRHMSDLVLSAPLTTEEFVKLTGSEPKTD